MVFPNYPNKHKQEALFHPGDFVDYKKWNKEDFPKNIVVVYQDSSLSYFKRKYSGKYRVLPFVGSHKVLKYRDVGFIKMKGIGAPHAVTVFEELIAMGADEFISVGTAGGLQEQGVFLCSKAVRDEGTSSHYISHSKYSYPDVGLTREFGNCLSESGIDFRVAPSWTVDAPYRETKAEIEHYRKEGIATVEMEASALFAVARYRNVKIASAFMVSDILGKKWDPRFHKKDMKRKLHSIVDAAITCLGHKT